MIPKQAFNILVVPESEGSSSTWYLSRRFLKNISIAGLICAFLLLIVIVHYVYLLCTLDTRLAVDLHNQELAQSLHSLQLKLQPIEREMRQVRNLTQKLQLLTTSADSNNREENALPLVSLSDTTVSLSALKDIEAQHIESQVLSENVDALSSEIRKQILSLSQLVDHFQSQGELRAILPSIHPVKGWLSSPFGTRLDPYSGESTMHTGVDFAAREGTVVVAPASGRVIFSGNDATLGNLLVIDHGVGYQTQYGHLKEALVELGAIVERGQPIAQVGNTGKSTGPHLHYEIRKFGIPVNPMQFMID